MSWLTVKSDTVDDWSQWFWFRSDVHEDNPDCNEKLLERHKKLALERNAIILDRGDWMDVMQSRDDKRRSQGGRRNEFGDDYFADVVRWTADRNKDIAHLFGCISPGNHESKVYKFGNVDLTSALAMQLGCAVQGYEGYTALKFHLQTMRYCVVVYHHHGWGGEAKRTKGVGQNDDLVQANPDAQILHLGHNHKAYSVPDCRRRMSQQGIVYLEPVDIIRSPGYLNSGLKANGYSSEKGHRPTRCGSYFVRFFWAPEERRVSWAVEFAG